jgi:drug/metabolite transporter (DMT)-like permease
MYVLIVIVAALLYALMSALMKVAVISGDVAAVLVTRYLFACATLVPIYFMSSRPTVATVHLRWHLLRGCIGFCMFVLYTLALERIPLQNALVLNSSYILFVPILLFLIFGQRPAGGAVPGLIVGFIGVAVVTGAHAHGYMDWGSLLAIGSAVATASATVLVARLRRTESSFTVLFYFFGVSFLLSGIWALVRGHGLAEGNWWLMGAVGALSAIYQQLLTFSLKHISTTLSSSIMTGSVVFGFMLEDLLFHHSPSLRDCAGSILILSGVLITLWADNRVHGHAREKNELAASL